MLVISVFLLIELYALYKNMILIYKTLFYFNDKIFKLLKWRIDIMNPKTQLKFILKN